MIECAEKSGPRTNLYENVMHHLIVIISCAWQIKDTVGVSCFSSKQCMKYRHTHWFPFDNEKEKKEEVIRKCVDFI